MREKKHISGFAIGMLLYILVFLLLAAAALFVLRLYLQAYEDSRVGNCVERSLAACREGELGPDWTKSLDGLDGRIQTEADGLAFLREKLADADCRELRGEKQGEKRYGLFDADGICFAELRMGQGDAGRWGFRSWTLESVDCELGAYTHSYAVTVPSDYRVFLGETELDERFITERDIPYETLAACRELVPRQPTMVHWEFGPVLGDGPLRVCNAIGREIPEEDWNELYYLANCSSTVRERLESFAMEYLNTYLPYAGDLNRAGVAYWPALREMIVRGGDLEERLYSVRHSFGFGNTQSIKIVDHTLQLCVDLKDGHYLVDLTYTTETVGLHGPVQELNRERLLLWEEDERLYTEATSRY